MKTLSSLFAALTFVVGAFAATPNQLTPEEKQAGWQLLFDGESLAGWKLNESPASVRLEDGSIVVNGPRAHLFYDGPVANHDFKNFELQLEVMTYAKANSGVYFHTLFQEIGWPKRGYEIQVNNSHTDPKRTGSVWGIKENMGSVAVDEQWFTLRIKVEGKRIQTFVGDRLVVDYTEEENVERPKQFAGRLIGSGTFALQAHDPVSKTRYRSIKVRVLP
ncbi:3-keto-disaccharide hydrolase [Oleiharenicola lentus]|uniref:3-keto-disaccharide hydrolase n=1 Tax=Oleiharenicola lentus TaxID=2508720 RepID=UPI003F666430